MRWKFNVASSVIAVATAMSAGAGGAYAQNVSEPAGESVASEEIIVTATRRETALQDTPSAITALTAETLQDMGADEFQDYARFVPGLFFTDAGPSRKKYVLRGVQAEITTGDSAPTVGQYLDEIPITAFGVNEPDPSLFDVERVEVLRGPQGTLFGASSMGGTVRTITNKPNLTEFGGLVEGTLSSTTEGGTGGGVNAMVNAPIVEGMLGVRAVLSYEESAGFIDSPRLGLEDVNSGERIGGRVMVRFQPIDSLDLTALYLTQSASQDASWRTDVASGELIQDTAILEPYEDDFDIYNVTANLDVGFGMVTATTSYFERNDSAPRTDQEYAMAFGFVGPLGAGAFASGERESEGTAHEIRFASDFEGPLSFVVGAFYNETSETSVQNLFDVNGEMQAAGFPTAPAGSTVPLFEEIVDREFSDTSIFGEATLRLGEDWDFTVGARSYDIAFEFTSDLTVSPVFLGAPPSSPPTVLNADSDGVTTKFRLTWRATDDILLYADASEGFRRGGTNIANSFRPFVPEAYDPDSLWSYELGYKTSWMDDRVTVNGALYQINWSDAQIKSLMSGPNGLGGTAFAFGVVNAGDAVIRGFEIEAMVEASENIDLGVVLNLMESELNSNSPGLDPLRGIEGDRLPGNAEVQGAAFVQYQAPLSSGLELMLRADVSHIGDRTTELRRFALDGSGVPNQASPNPNYFVMGGYNTVNLRAGLIGDVWEAIVFANNVTDERADQLFYTPFGQIAAGTQRTPIRPRTMGVTLRRAF